jgi:hypothetical protein
LSTRKGEKLKIEMILFLEGFLPRQKWEKLTSKKLVGYLLYLFFFFFALFVQCFSHECRRLIQDLFTPLTGLLPDFG